jgi:hypothetical protein
MARTNTNTEARTNTEAKTVELVRANRIAVQASGTGYKADFYRTHKKLATLISEDTSWEADESMNKSAQREDFRKFAIEHSADIGIDWNPSDMRTDENKRVAKYETEAQLLEDVRNMMEGDIRKLITESGLDIKFMGLPAWDMTAIPVTHSAKGTDLAKLGVIDGKYEKSGNWAWANIEAVAVIEASNGQEIYYSFTCQLVSGQLKKPHITKTSFGDSIKESLKEIGLITEEAKAEESAKAEAEEVQEEATPKKSNKGKKSKTATAQA